MVVFLGADGSGKSSVTGRLGQVLKDVFTKSHYIHLRPGLGMPSSANGTDATNPHGSQARGRLGSMLKILYFLVDYTAGYFWKVRPLLKDSLVVFDRYYHDILVDPRRYRYRGPMWLVRWGAKLVPKPDIFVLLDAPPEVLYSRKQEVAFAETVRQREAYLDLIGRLNNGRVVDASVPLDQVIADVRRIILGALPARRAGTHPTSATGSVAHGGRQNLPELIEQPVASRGPHPGGAPTRIQHPR
jgi:thymidylate kinase